MEPTAEEVRNIKTVLDCLKWAGMSDASGQHALQSLGLSEDDLPRMLAITAESDLTAALDVYLIDGVVAPMPTRNRIRLGWRAALKCCAQTSSAVSTRDSLGLGLLGDFHMVRLDSSMKLEMENIFRMRYPTELVQDEHWPSHQVLRQFYNMLKSGNWTWIPWKQLLSKAQAETIKDRRGPKRSADATLLQVLAETAGLEDECSEDMSSSPFRVQQVLSVRMNALALLECGHLNSFKTYVQEFMKLYTRRPLPSSGMRVVNWEEAEASDHEVWKTLIKMIEKKISWDDSLYECTVVRDLLSHQLQHRLAPVSSPPKKQRFDDKDQRPQKGPQSTSPGKGAWSPKGNKGSSSKGGSTPAKGQRKGDGKANSQMGETHCFRYQLELCRSSTCRYEHKCMHCGGAHPGNRCTSSTAPATTGGSGTAART